MYKNVDSSVRTEKGYELDVRGSIPSMGKKFLSSPKRQDRLWISFSLLSKGFRELILQG
jgi:hypothetical protein